jgi:voltage-gated potassium channel
MESRAGAHREARERRCLVLRIERWLETPMLVLGGAWTALLILELTRGLSPFLARVGTAIWVVFVAEFALRLAVAPRRRDFLRRHVLTLLSLALPALRMLRVVAVARVLGAARGARGLRLVRVVASLNRGMRALDRTLRRRGFGYVLALTVLVALVGAAGMHAFEREVEGGLGGYPEALWWTAMLLTTVGSEYWPRTAEGRLLALLLSVYAVTTFGYLAATLASYFIDRDARERRGRAEAPSAVASLRAEVATLRAELRRARSAGSGDAG